MTRKSTEERFWSFVDRSDPTACWTWQGYVDIYTGYGKFRLGTTRNAHRVAYILTHGEVPDGMQLDHLCRVRSCVNPSHLEPVTNRENTIRGIGPALRRAGPKVDKCVAGHPYDDANTGYERNGNRKCLACARLRWRPRSTAPIPRRRGPLRDVTHQQGRRAELSCGHVLIQSGGGRPLRSRCAECESELESMTAS